MLKLDLYLVQMIANRCRIKFQHSLLLRTKSSDGHIEVRSANSTVFYVGSSPGTTPALKINANRSTTFANAFTLPKQMVVADKF